MKPILLYWRNKRTSLTLGLDAELVVDQVTNPSKVPVILEELGLPYETTWVELDDLKKQPFESINPNGRLPDKEHKLTYTSSPEKYFLQQWSYFQASGQGPYFGQCAWFTLFHPEKLESAQTRYANELKRIVGVLDRTLKGQEWLVGDKSTYADLAFVMWNAQIDSIMKGHDWNIAEYPNFRRWQETMLARDSLKKVMSVLMDKEVQSPGRV
ncbi:hypothetical protein JMJ35_002581 [Cladonia borealis]|uniref:glutathione transferase n=1 Tax=Cladonia borealis TaxID=184061 RepID=A0AA39V441_9LECA|nr:hypothetical protein JMJ35_002581 [Cladonia borealis]